MRRRHELVEIDTDLARGSDDDVLDSSATSDVGVDDVDHPALIDESHPPSPILREAIGGRKPTVRAASAVASRRPDNPARTSLGWGLGTDGWPRHNSRLVRLLACEPDGLLRSVVGMRWGSLDLGDDVRRLDGDDWPRVVSGSLQMPYPSAPLRVELHAQPFHDRYCRVDLVLCSQHRRPRRYFDVASRCVSEMRILERTPAATEMARSAAR